MNAPRDGARLQAVEPTNWTELNQRWLSAQVAALRERLREQWTDKARDSAAVSDAAGLAKAGTTNNASAVESAIDDASFTPPLERIARRFGLSPFERELLLLAAGYQLDRELRVFLHQPPSFSFALACLPNAHWDAIGPLRPLRYWRLLDFPVDSLLLEAPLSVDERILHCLAGVAAIDERLLGLATFRPPSNSAHPAAARAAAALTGITDSGNAVLVWVEGQRDAVGLQLIATDAAHAAGRAALVVSLADIPGEPRARAELSRRLDREAVLAEAVIVLAHDGASEPAAEQMRHARSLIESLHAPVIASGRFDSGAMQSIAGRQPIRIAVGAVASQPSRAARLRTRAFSGEAIDDAVRQAAAQFRVAESVFDECLDRLHADDAKPVQQQLWQHLREASRGGLDQLARRVESRAKLSDIVLPAAQLGQLLEIASHLQHRHTVYEDWGFGDRGSRGLGIAALFCGESGTGKTMAAEAIANHVGLDLYRIDLAHTVSKYIGETEKNLGRIFDAAEASGAVLLFDEADALFGKRSEVKDSHDRYANIEVAYLLQRIEAYRGLAILTTNLKSSLDRAFQRRIRFIINFTFPDEASRCLLWQRQWPERAPLCDIDYEALAHMPLAGGHIRNVALNAAFLAAEAGEPISMRLLDRALQREAAKLERSLQIDSARRSA